jgi:SAM-dependent methyltransferase
MTTDAAAIGTTENAGDEAVPLFVRLAAEFEDPRTLEMGTLRWVDTEPTHHQVWVPHATRYTMTDVSPGLDVDVVADAHDFEPFEDEAFDLVISCSVWEHLRLPWVCAQAMARIMAPGAVAIVATHQTFPIHGYPSDYTRWTDKGLAAMFEWAGLETVHVQHVFPARIIPPREVTRWSRDAPAFLNVVGVFRKPS